MTLKGDAFEFTIGSVDRTFSYVVSAGLARSPRYTVTALTAPRVERIDLHYVYPSFAGLAPRDEQDGGDIYAPAGTRVRLRIQTDKPIANGELAWGVRRRFHCNQPERAQLKRSCCLPATTPIAFASPTSTG